MSQYRHFRCKHLYCVVSVALFSKPIEIEICCLFFPTLNAPSYAKKPQASKLFEVLFSIDVSLLTFVLGFFPLHSICSASIFLEAGLFLFSHLQFLICDLDTSYPNLYVK